MTLKSDTKFKEKLTSGFKYNMKDLVNFLPITQKSKSFTSMGYFCPKYISFELKKYRGVIMTLKGDAKFKGRLTCGLKNNIQNLVNFHASSWKSKNFHFDQILKDLNENAQKNYVSWHWRVMQSLKKNWLLVPKMTWGIWGIFNELLKSPKISLRWAIFVRSIWGFS